MCEYGVAGRLTDAHVAATNAPIAHRRTVTYQYRTAGDGVVADLEAPIALLRQDGTARARYDYDRAGNLVRRRVVGALAADPIDEHTLVYDGGQRQRAATAPNGTRQVDYYDSSGSRALQVLKGSGVEFQFHSQLGHMLVSLNESMQPSADFSTARLAKCSLRSGLPMITCAGSTARSSIRPRGSATTASGTTTR